MEINDDVDRALPIALKDMAKDDAKIQPNIIINCDGVLTKKYEAKKEEEEL